MSLAASARPVVVAPSAPRPGGLAVAARPGADSSSQLTNPRGNSPCGRMTITTGGSASSATSLSIIST